MPKFTTSLSGAIVLQASYDTYTDTAGTTAANTNGAQIAALKSGSINATQATSGRRPTIVSGGSPWGLDCIRYDGTDDFLRDASISIGADFTIVAVAYHHRRSKITQNVIAQVGADTANFYTMSSWLTIYDGVVRNAEISMPNQWSMVGLSCGTDRLFVADNREVTVAVGSKITASTAMTFGAFSDASFAGRLDVLMYIVFPTTSLTSANFTTLRSELAAYLGSLPLSVSSSKTLAIVEGNSLLGAGCYADLTNSEYPGLAAGTRWEIRNIGVSGSTSTTGTNSLNARRAYRDAYPASVGRTRANSVLIMGEGANAPADSSGFIAEVNYAVAQGWGAVVVVLPPPTSGWSQGDANVTTFYNTVKAYGSFASNVYVLDSRQGVLATYNGTYFADAVHLSQAGHTALGGFLTTTLALVPSFDSTDDGEDTMTIDSSNDFPVTIEWSEVTVAAEKQFRFGFSGDGQKLWWKVAASAPSASAVGDVAKSDQPQFADKVASGKKLWVRTDNPFTIVVHVAA